MSSRVTVACLDVGSVKRDNVGWVVLGSVDRNGTDLGEFVTYLLGELSKRYQVAIGFECPLYVPRRSEPLRLTNKRMGEVGVNWCGGPGGAVLATGLVQVNWVLGELARGCKGLTGTTRVNDFRNQKARVLIWEAFVSGTAGAKVEQAKIPTSCGSQHERDAFVAAAVFRERYESGLIESDLEEEPAQSLVALPLLGHEMTKDIALIWESCLVVMASKPA